MTAPYTRDARYTISKEYTGAADRQYVVRFCMEWISSHPTKLEAIKRREFEIAERAKLFEEVKA